MAELLPHLEDVLFAGHSGVVVKMAEAGLRTPDQQSEILKTLLTVFHAETNTSVCVPLFLTLTAYEVYAEHVQSRESDSDLERVGNETIHFHTYSLLPTFCCTEECACTGFSVGASTGQV